MDSSLSLKILHEEMQADDLVLCWQTNKMRGAVGICLVDRLVDYDHGERKIWLERIGDPFDVPVRFTELKRTNPILGNAHCLMPGGGTLFRTTGPEAVEILKACGVPRSRLQAGVSVSKSVPVVPPALKKGAGLGSPENNKLVEAAAVNEVACAKRDSPQARAWSTGSRRRKSRYPFVRSSLGAGETASTITAVTFGATSSIRAPCWRVVSRAGSRLEQPGRRR